MVAPKSRWKLTSVLCNTGQGGWSLADGEWDENPTLGIRWNGDDDTGGHGNPQSHGNPTWFILPEELHESARKIGAAIADTINFVTCDFTRPAEFDYGVFRVSMSLLGEKLAGQELFFEIPTLPKRFFRYDDMRFMVPRTSATEPSRGRFINGEWKAIMQTNGVTEDENPTSRGFVKDMLRAQVVRALSPWR